MQPLTNTTQLPAYWSANSFALTNRSAILVVEDDPNDALLLQLAFEAAGFAKQVSFVNSAREALHYLSGENAFADRSQFPLPNVLLLDLKMQPLSGFDVLSWIRERSAFQRMPVIVFSTSECPQDVDRAYRLGANSFLVKPVRFDVLTKTLKCMADFWLMQCRLPEFPFVGADASQSQVQESYSPA